ncbi:MULTISPECIES: peptidoglycan-associated lipoprotein Pal [Denitromonas]|jgi:peptidoglycan-associated lipoprotein|uniref:Peptidoglycan-associated lipoprotein n=2 Tax=Denitromonas TaxID=139331 RepID=A0A557QXV2_9RHOO|nr:MULTISPECIES: peptidoglycan-associated lipoprotein Pal [Denitromonas]MCZ4304702.1 peptidoglycan-associated lipoprotein Pal [Zoogloeaceae bacterium G21618-S1]TVO57709.1 peptidoglycan-associated lipoprotein Pal [Denitromonas halophila]TVO68016.1 peptidoglycan-associated lipoprotein Pal [Denitromonas ohlonensis]TVO78079.1 peptidoglycan-associated lipoprotein Pal [Denitromonas ohlonensis]TVT45356.1 MAG: peptidoglycan-associated lipoprotein Pal [Denitromonas halophila]
MRYPLAASMLALALLAGCSSTPMTADQGASVEDRTASSAGTIPTVRPDQMQGAGLAALRDPNNILSKRAIMFDYDSFTIRGEFMPLVEAHGRFLAANPQMKMLIQGSADERGSREYNLALGQKRSDAVKKSLMLLGAKEGQIESVSLGEEKPQCTERNEACYAENRRGEMLYAGEF